MLATATDGEAIRPVRDDPALVLEALYARHAPDAVRFGALLTGNRAAGEDLAHDAFLDATGRLGALRDPTAFGPYLRSCVARRHLMAQRAGGRDRTRNERTASPERVADPVEHIGRDLVLVAALARLTASQRVAVVLRYWHDLPEAEIARTMRCRRGTVKSTLSRALAALREEVPTDVDS